VNGLKAETVTVNGIRYRIGVARELANVDQITVLRAATVIGAPPQVDMTEVYSLPGVPVEAALVMRAQTWAHDDGGRFRYLILLGPGDAYPGICIYLPSASSRCP
jgi:hypothetical protein